MGIVADVNLYEQEGLEYIEVLIEPRNPAISLSTTKGSIIIALAVQCRNYEVLLFSNLS